MQSTLPLLLLLPTLITASCSTFQPLTGGNTFTNFTTTAYNITISEALTCPPSNTSCWFGSNAATVPPRGNYTFTDALIGGIVTVNRTIGVSTNANGSDNGMYNTGNYLSSDAVNNLFSLIQGQTRMNFLQQATTNLTGEAGYGLYAGRAGYAVFQPSLNCVRGVLGGCSGDGYPQEDTAVEACEPIVEQGLCNGKYGCGPVGGIYFVEVPSNEIGSVPECWPCEEEMRLTGAAVGMRRVDVSVLVGLVVGVMMWVG